MKYLTFQGLKKVKKELSYLKTVERKKIAEKLKHAISFGDLSENFAYHEAKEAQAFLEGKILRLEGIIREAQVVESAHQRIGASTRCKRGGDKIQIGSIVLLEFNNEREQFQVVGAEEAKPQEGKISYQSPLGRALLGKSVKTTTKIKTPGGKVEYKILKID